MKEGDKMRGGERERGREGESERGRQDERRGDVSFLCVV